MKNLKKITLSMAIIGLFVFSSCEESDPEPKLKCLVCEGSTSDDSLCEGDKDPDSGEEVTLEVLEFARDLANAFGGNCTLENK